MSEQPAASGGDLLVAADVRKEFGGLIAVNDLTFTIPNRSIVSLIGPNGAGKTTFFNTLTGLYKVTDGQITFDGHDVTDKPPHAITKLGVGRTFQNIRLFPQMTALENVLVGMHSRLKGGIVGSVLRLPRVRREEREAEERARELLRFSGLRNVDDELAESLSYGDQRRLEVARALATEPKLLLLDEPTAGMNPQETTTFMNFVSKLREEQPIAILLIEHDMKVVMSISDRVTVLDYGEKIAEGEPQQLAKTNGSSGEVILHVDGIHTFYGTIEALKGITIEVRDGEIVTLIGANGAGKSTTLHSINGLNQPREGTIEFRGKDITRRPPHDIVAMGISQSPEGRRLFPHMSVIENLEMGAFQRSDRREIREDLDRVYGLFPRLAERKNQKAGTMSGGEQQMCAIGRALMARPQLLMLDEPSMGLAPIFVEKIFEIIDEINKQGTTILLVEQNALMALDAADRGYVLETGRVALADKASALKTNEQVRKTYLGE